MARYYYITPDDYIAAEKNGIDKLNLENRVRKLGWSIERAVKEPLRKRAKRDEWYELAVSNGIIPNTYFMRLSLGWDKKTAATKPVMSKEEVDVEANNGRRIYPKELIKLAHKNGIEYATFTTRINRDGMTPLEAATMPKKGPGGREILNEI